MVGCAQASPSLALLKYWGKASTEKNLPSTTSLALTLGGLRSLTRVRYAEEDQVRVNGEVQDPGRFRIFLDSLRRDLGFSQALDVESENNFPTSAGLASSSSGFAALAGAVAALCGIDLGPVALSRLARLGSGSATRSVFGGFTLFPAGAEEARQLHDEKFWPELRVLLIPVRDQAKSVSSRVAMESSRRTSPFFQEWVTSSEALVPRGLEALESRDLRVLGPLMRLSYLRMFSTMFSADPPILYWYPESLALLRFCEELREDGLDAWETMDAGPQVKILCTAGQQEAILARLNQTFPQFRALSAGPGPGIRIWTEAD